MSDTMRIDHGLTRRDLRAFVSSVDPAQWHKVCNAHARARELAEHQVTDAEISASLAVEFGLRDDDADRVVALMAPLVLRHRHYGRANLRSWLYRAASGQVHAKELSTGTLAAASMLGRQHLGYTSEGVDDKVRKFVEKAERKAARGRGGMRVVA